MKPAACVLMAKQPVPGRAKTRLCPPLTLQQAAALAEALLRDSIALAAAQPGIDLAVAISPPGAEAYFAGIIPPGTHLLAVEGGDIGACLCQALGRLLALGWRKVLALNADGPTLPPEYLDQAVAMLDENDIVIGPALDGGYYLVGVRRLHPGLFAGISWSTSQVLAQTLDRARSLGLRAGLTPAWYDIDTPDDLQRLRSALERLPPERLAHTRAFFADFELEDPGKRSQRELS